MGLIPWLSRTLNNCSFPKATLNTVAFPGFPASLTLWLALTPWISLTRWLSRTLNNRGFPRATLNTVAFPGFPARLMPWLSLTTRLFLTPWISLTQWLSQALLVFQSADGGLYREVLSSVG